MSSVKLPFEFYQQDTIDVATQLLGKKLVYIKDGKRLSGLIVETEAYLGGEDPACHSFGFKNTKRTETMFLPGGHCYVYFIYGMYHCFNVVSSKRGAPEAVLIRALEPIEGIDLMTDNRPVKKLKDLCNGPGKLCKALAIDMSVNKKSLLDDEMFIEEGPSLLSSSDIEDSPRVGISNAHDAVHWPLRFYIKNNLFVSKP